MWGRRCHGAHGGASSVGATLASQAGSGLVCPQGRGTPEKERLAGTGKARPRLRPHRGGAGAGALPSQFQGWEHERCRTLPIPDTARQPRAVPG